MKFSIFSHAEHYLYKGRLYSYGPYIKEMNFWISEFDNVSVVAPLLNGDPKIIDSEYIHENITIVDIPRLHYKGTSIFKSIASSLKTLVRCFKEMRNTDHIHIRCPGNVGMLAIMVSSLFPSKPKTIKYAGNWDPGSQQPLSYKFQKWWLSNTYLTRNSKVLVYGKWKNQSRNIIPFFTASFKAKESLSNESRVSPPFRFIFCGSLVKGKDPMWALKTVHQMKENGCQVILDFYGEGAEYQNLNLYVQDNSLKKVVTFHGNQNQEILKLAYKKSHFCILPSESEGWPKVLAEAMFFGCIPISTKVSCIPWMLNQGERGILIDKLDIEGAVTEIHKVISDPILLKKLRYNSQSWSRNFTLERFRDEIKTIL